eukprot:11256631-Heterocapsa_arctica.AAC.1
MGSEKVPGRMVAAKVEAPGHGAVMVVSIYMVAGNELGMENLEILEKLGRVLATRDCPFIVGGDFNMNP